MDYEAPMLFTPGEVYEAPILVNLEELTGEVVSGCDTGGIIIN